MLFHQYFILLSLNTQSSLRSRDKSSGGTAGFIFTSTYPRVSGTGEAPPYYLIMRQTHTPVYRRGIEPAKRGLGTPPEANALLIEPRRLPTQSVPLKK